MAFLVEGMREVGAASLSYTEDRGFCDTRNELAPLLEQPMMGFEPEERRMALLGGAVLVGGFALGVAAAESINKGFVEEVIPQDQTALEGVVAFGVGCLGLVLFGGLMLETIEQYGAETVAAGVGGTTVVALLIRAARG